LKENWRIQRDYSNPEAGESTTIKIYKDTYSELAKIRNELKTAESMDNTIRVLIGAYRRLSLIEELKEAEKGIDTPQSK
jgi:predicted CopG family antitoxin